MVKWSYLKFLGLGVILLLAACSGTEPAVESASQAAPAATMGGDVAAVTETAAPATARPTETATQAPAATATQALATATEVPAATAERPTSASVEPSVPVEEAAASPPSGQAEAAEAAAAPGPTEEQLQLLASLPGKGPAPELFNEVWLNSEPLKLADLRGKVVLIEFWTFG